MVLLESGGAKLQEPQNTSSFTGEQSDNAVTGKFLTVLNAIRRRVGILRREKVTDFVFSGTELQSSELADDISMEVAEDESHIFCRKS